MRFIPLGAQRQLLEHLERFTLPIGQADNVDRPLAERG